MGADVAAAGRLHLGDRVAGAADGMEGLRPQSGAFAEYVSMDGDMALQMPDNMSFAEGAGMGLRIATASMAIFHSLGIPAELLQTPAEEKKRLILCAGLRRLNKYGDDGHSAAEAVRVKGPHYLLAGTL